MTGDRTTPPHELVDDIRARIAPLFPGWAAEQVEMLVQQMASVEWRYSAGNDAEQLGTLAVVRALHERARSLRGVS